MEFEMIETKKISENREIEALKHLAAFGFLTTKSIAELTEGVTGDSALKSAKRVIKRLVDNREILKRESLEGINCYVLSEKGARRVKPFCFKQRAKTGAELETRFAKRQEFIVAKLNELKSKSGGELLGEVWLKRDSKKFFVGLHGVLWSDAENKGIGVYFISSIRSETAAHVINLEKKLKTFIKEIHLISFEDAGERVLRRKMNQIKRNRPLPPIDL